MDTTSAPLSKPDAASLALHAVAERLCAAAQDGWVGQPQRASLEQLALSQQLDEAHWQVVQQRGELATQAAHLDQQQRRLEHALRFVDQQQAELDAQRVRLRSQRRRVGADLKQRRADLNMQLEQLRHSLATTGASASDSTSQVAQLLRERDDLLPRLEGANSDQSAANQKAADDKTYELRRRFEMAVEDMRAYKLRVAELEEQLAQRPKSVEKAAVGVPLNWAQQKANMLASLETDLDGSDQQSVDDRLTVEGAVRITDEVVAVKEREIEQLQRQLVELRAQRTTASAQDACVAAILDNDAVIAAERERLRKLQESVLDKQRTAEVELAMERATIARQLAEMEDRLHAMESDLAHQQGSSVASDNSAPVSRSLRGRWLARPGLKDGDGGA